MKYRALEVPLQDTQCNVIHVTSNHAKAVTLRVKTQLGIEKSIQDQILASTAWLLAITFVVDNDKKLQRIQTGLQV